MGMTPKKKKKFKALLRAAFQDSCAYCLVRFKDTKPRRVRVTFDHFIPLALGGTWRLENLIPACQKCNNEKGDLDPAAWLRVKKVDLELFHARREVWVTWVWDNHRTICYNSPDNGEVNPTGGSPCFV